VDNINPITERVMVVCLDKMPEDPIDFIVNYLQENRD
jgi:hypothetical protein